MSSRGKRRSIDRKVIGIKHDRFKSKLDSSCHHNWQVFGVPLTANGVTRRVLRCCKCTLTKMVKTKGGAS